MAINDIVINFADHGRNLTEIHKKITRGAHRLKSEHCDIDEAGRLV